MHSFFRHFKLYLTSSTERFSQNFKVVVVDGKNESEYSVKWQDFFSGHVVGEYGACLPWCLGWEVSGSNLTVYLYSFLGEGDGVPENC